MPDQIPTHSESRSRRPSVRWRVQWRYDFRWEPEVDLVTGMSGYGLREGLRIWWRLRRGTWRDDDPFDVWMGDDTPIVGHCSKCGEARESFYTCRDGGETIPLPATP